MMGGPAVCREEKPAKPKARQQTAAQSGRRTAGWDLQADFHPLFVTFDIFPCHLWPARTHTL